VLCTILVPQIWCETKCGISKVSYYKTPWRIYGGVPVKPQEFPWQISIGGPNYHSCGGTIISDQWLLTAAHCPESSTIDLGDTDFRNKDGKELQVEVDKWIIHPLNQGNHLRQYDVTLIKLKNKLDFEGAQNYLAPVCLATEEDDANFLGKHITATGWGMNEKIEMPDILQKVELPLLTFETCEEILGKANVALTNRTICAGGEGIKTICFGDSGGPLQGRREDGSWAQLGISSFIMDYGPGGQGCITESPGFFARVSQFRNWIQETMDKN